MTERAGRRTIRRSLGPCNTTAVTSVPSSCIFSLAFVPSLAFAPTLPVLIVLLLFFPFSSFSRELSRLLVPDLCAFEDAEERRDLFDFGEFDNDGVVGAKNENGLLFVISVRMVSSLDIVGDAEW